MLEKVNAQVNKEKIDYELLSSKHINNSFFSLL